MSFVLAATLLAGSALAQTQTEETAAARVRPSASDNAIRIRSVSIEQADDGLAVAISSNGALVPAITKLDGPPRLVIDLAGAVNAVPRARVPGSDAIKSIRVSQYQSNPPLTRVVVDLAESRSYAWETVQNKLIIHLRRPDEAENAPADKAPAFTTGTDPAITYAGNAPSGTLQEVDQQTSGPSTVTASEETTVLNLARGGQIRVCPGTTISVNSSQDRRDVMVGMSTGSFEAHYALNDSADSIVTPDFRILLPGPGQFELAISADSRGNTCVRSLPGNTASAVVSELMGDGTYQVKANEQVVFHAGQLSKAGHDVPIDCGCPPAQTPVLRAEAAPPPTPATTSTTGSDTDSTAEKVAGNPGDGGGVAVRMSVTPEMAALPVKPSETHMEVDAPLVFRGTDPLPAPTEDARKLPARSNPPDALAIIPLPPPVPESAPPPKPRTGFMGKFKHFLSSVFG